MERTFILLSVKEDREPRITNNTQDAVKTTLGVCEVHLVLDVRFRITSQTAGTSSNSKFRGMKIKDKYLKFHNYYTQQKLVSCMDIILGSSWK
jgi:hypothetical protein